MGGTDDAPQLSQMPGEGSGSMASLVQKAMLNILTPFVKRLDDLEEAAAVMVRDIKDAHEKADSATQRLGQHDRSIATLEGDMIRAKSDFKRVHELISEGSEKHTALENDHDATRAMTRRLDAEHKSAASHIADHQRLHEDLDGRCRQLQQALSETNIAHIHINDRHQELRNRVEGLNDRHLDLVKSSQELRQADDAQAAALKRLASGAEKQRRDAERSLAQLDDRSKSLELAVLELQNADDKLAKAVKVAKQDAELHKSLIDQLHGGKGDSGPRPADIHARMAKIEEMVGKLATALNTDRSSVQHNLQQLRDAVSQTLAGLAKNTSDCDQVDRAVKDHDRRLQKVDQRCSVAEGQAEKLKDQLARLGSELGNQLGQTQASFQDKLDTQVHELAKLNERISQGGSRTEALQSGLDNVKTEMASTNAAVGKLGQKLDLAHEYVQGMSKGLTDTHRRVHGDGALTARGSRPGSRGGTGLPVIR
eukprot:CAMPEP_0176259082 /NCGR_PEP_ID=MMETSP0121_2-20121125/38892_1 /TAXON_ID=160619 /ORGANISM="Kryptoperidinium foliaceum, Strain CCMP 1326" /LENGTH=480 /DNA_ID=CAMNT_0017598967 /DNA_START=19 /DNA_END=1457 /DNA_ORIENTATION=+